MNTDETRIRTHSFRSVFHPCSSVAAVSLETQPLGGGPDAGQLVVGAQVEGAAVVAEAAVGRLVVGQDAAEQRAVRGEHVQAVDRGGEDVPLLIDLQPVGQSLLRLGRLHVGGGVVQL